MDTDILFTAGLAIAGAGTGAVLYGVRVRRIAAERINDALDCALFYVRQSSAFAELVADADQRALNAEVLLEELNSDFGDVSQELTAAKIEMAETNSVCDAYAKQCQATDDVVSFLTGVVNRGDITYLASSQLIEAQAESLIRVGLRKEISRGPGTIGRASDLEMAA